MKKLRFYVVWTGRNPGIYSTWEECKAQVDGFPQARYKSFPSEDVAKAEFNAGYTRSAPKAEKKSKSPVGTDKIIYKSISVDAACNMQTGDMEYQGVFTDTKKPLFRQGPYDEQYRGISCHCSCFSLLQTK